MCIWLIDWLIVWCWCWRMWVYDCVCCDILWCWWLCVLWIELLMDVWLLCVCDVLNDDVWCVWCGWKKRVNRWIKRWLVVRLGLVDWRIWWIRWMVGWCWILWNCLVWRSWMMCLWFLGCRWRVWSLGSWCWVKSLGRRCIARAGLRVWRRRLTVDARCVGELCELCCLMGIMCWELWWGDVDVCVWWWVWDGVWDGTRDARSRR